MRQEGIEWKLIARGLGVDPIKLKKRIETVEQHGLKDSRVAITDEHLRKAIRMRENGLGLTCIATYLQVDRNQLQIALWNDSRRGRKKPH
jgi:hypothetical protein